MSAVADPRAPRVAVRAPGLGEAPITLALDNERLRFRQCLFGAQHLSLRAPELRFVFRRGDEADDLSRHHVVTFIHRQNGEPAGIFGRDVNLRGLDAAVRLHDPIGQPLATQPRDQIAHHRLGVCGGDE
jgi:hypothetical protein